mmetsp:Transcript_15743/g.34409  ORF Transcript_15743/g.34409 Transcript_15743/m.34409 type:complete len:200 (+) Transcript_15743:1818-2417(+)
MSSCEFVSATEATRLCFPSLLGLLPRLGPGLSSSPSNSRKTPESWRTFLLASPPAWLSSKAMRPVFAKRGRFSSLLEMYIRRTIMSFRKILSLKRYPRERTAPMKSRKHSTTSSWPRASLAACQSSSRTFQSTSAATRSTSEPNKLTRITCTKFEISPLLVICLARGLYKDMSRIAPSVMITASGLSSALKEEESASST